MYNADFNPAAYEEIMLEAGLNRFIMSVKQLVSRTNSNGIVAKAGRYGGTYAYKDIAFEFAGWVSPQFKCECKSVIICENMHCALNFKQWIYFPEKRDNTKVFFLEV